MFHHESVSNRIWRSQQGYTLVELVVVLVIISILAAVSVTSFERQYYRNKEKQLQTQLVDFREAVDRFHSDWLLGYIDRTSPIASANGYPKSPDVLVAPAEVTIDGVSMSRRYLRKLPQHPFASEGTEFSDNWIVFSSTDAPEATLSNGVDVFDIRSSIERVALDGSDISTW